MRRLAIVIGLGGVVAAGIALARRGSKGRPGSSPVAATADAAHVADDSYVATMTATISPTGQSRHDDAFETALDLARRWSDTDGFLAAKVLDTIVDEVDLCARDYGRLLYELDRLGITVHPDDEGEDVVAGDDDIAQAPSDDLDATGPVDGFGEFMRRSRHPVLTAEEERDLAATIESGELAARALEGEIPASARQELEARVSE